MRLTNGLSAVLRFADDRKPRLIRQRSPEQLPEQRMVVGQE
jgi:hypothetical protein